MTSIKVIEENERTTTTRGAGVCDCGCGCGIGVSREASARSPGRMRPTKAIKALYRRALGRLHGPCGCDGSCGCGGVARK